MRISKNKKKQYKAYARMQRRRAHKLRNHPFVVPVITFLFLFFASMAAFIAFNSQTIGAADSRIVNVNIDGKSQSVPTRAATVGELLKRLNVEVGPDDVVEPPLDTPITQDNFTINVYHARPVTIVDGGHKISLLTPVANPRTVVQKAGIKLYPEDTVTLAASADALNEGTIGEQLIVEHALPVTLSLYGQTIPIRTHAKTVHELLEERGIKDKDVTVYPAADTVLKADDVVYVTDPGKNILLEEVLVPQGQTFVDDYNLAYGKTEVREQGRPGKKVLVYDVPKDHPEQKRLIQEVLASEPVDQIVARGRKINTASVAGDKAALMAAAGISPGDYYAVDYIIGRESGWKPGSISGSGCAGLGQACPASKLANACPNWSTDPVCQLRFFSGYAQRYGGWQEAYFVWQTQGWW